MSSIFLFLALFLFSAFQVNGYYYNNCASGASCSSGCCQYSSSLYLSYTYCPAAATATSTTGCLCLNSTSLCTGATPVGYNNCSLYTSCTSKCCYFSISLSYSDPACSSYFCTCSSYSSSCGSTSSSSTSTSTSTGTSYGYHYCSTTTCSSGCCYYSTSLTYTDTYCTSYYCQCASYYSSCSSTSSTGSSIYSYYSSWNAAATLSASSGKEYVVVNYPAWKAVVAIGASIAGIWFFLVIYLAYFKCCHKPRNFISS